MLGTKPRVTVLILFLVFWAVCFSLAALRG
jgi:hypothetical protein